MPPRDTVIGRFVIWRLASLSELTATNSGPDPNEPPLLFRMLEPEIYTKHPLITPLDQFGIAVPPVLHSIAYF